MISLPYAPRAIRATESRLKKIYTAAYAGLKGDSLAIACGMLPVEYKQLCELDSAAYTAALQGKADAELEHATLLAQASRDGDSKATLAILQHQHGWRSKDDENTKQGITVVIQKYVDDTVVIEGERV